jgi:uncharacterized integral membrane protein
MPDLDRTTWLLIAAAAVVVVLLAIVIANRRGRERVEDEIRVRRSQTLRVGFVLILLALIVGFAVANTATVEIDWIATTTRAPMVVVIAVSGGVGFLAGILATYRSRPSQS